jgi:hypothetical protein
MLKAVGRLRSLMPGSRDIFARARDSVTTVRSADRTETRVAPRALRGRIHVAPPPLIDGASRSRPILAWTGFALPAQAARSRVDVYAFLEYASRPEVDREVTAGSQNYSPVAASNDTIEDPIAREFLPLFEDAISPIDWLWEPEITAEIDSQVQALVKGTTDAPSAARAVQGVSEGLRRAGRSYYP